MAEIFQQFSGMADAAHAYRNLGQDRMTAAQDHLSNANALAAGAWCSSDYDDYFANATLQVNETHAHATDAINRGVVVDQCAADGQAKLAITRAIAASLKV